MTRRSTPELAWSAKTLLVGVFASVVGLLAVLGVLERETWPEFWLGPYLVGGLCGAFAVFAMHPRRPIVTVLVIAPVMTFLLVVGAFLFSIYVLGEPIEL
jgi:uncharacterized membrane protein HdeD (DUF308 family)